MNWERKNSSSELYHFYRLEKGDKTVEETWIMEEPAYQIMWHSRPQDHLPLSAEEALAREKSAFRDTWFN